MTEPEWVEVDHRIVEEITRPRARLAEVEARLELMTREARLSREATERAVARLAEVEAELGRAIDSGAGPHVCQYADRLAEVEADLAATRAANRHVNEKAREQRVRAEAAEARLAAVLAVLDDLGDVNRKAEVFAALHKVRAVATGEDDQ